MDVVVVRTGLANVASVLAALRRCGTSVTLSDEAAAIREAERVVFPGVGSFGAVTRFLDDRRLRDVFRERIAAGRATLGICLGMQVLFEGSDESPGAAGLASASGTVERFDTTKPVPQMGWNRVDAGTGCVVLRGGHAYFAHSFRVVRRPEGWACATACYDGEFVCGIERGSVVACQFHPELSGAFGRGLLERWLERSRQEVPA